MRLSVDLRNAQANQLEAILGASPILEIRSGAAPAGGVAAADTGTLLCSMTLPADWVTAAANGQVTKLGTWSGLGAAGAGAGTNAGHVRFKTSGGVAKMDCSVTATGGGGECELDNISIATGQTVVVTAFTYTRNNS